MGVRVAGRGRGGGAGAEQEWTVSWADGIVQEKHIE